MTILNSSYETTMCQSFPYGKLEQALKEALISTGLAGKTFGVLPIGNQHAVFVSGIDPEETKIPPFIHPFLIKNFKGDSYLITDIRAFKATTQLYPSTKDFEESVRNKSEYALVKSRAVLELRWAAGDAAKLRSQLSFAGSVFGSWISQSVSKTYALDYHDQLRVAAIAIYYYHGLFTSAKKLEDQHLEAAVIHTINATKLPAQEVYALFEKLPEMSNAEDLCLAIQNGLENVRLRDFSFALMLTILKNSWYGINAKEMIATAIEYPPAWISIVYAALTEKTYRNSPIYKLVEIQAKRGRNIDEFKMNFLDLVQKSIITESVDNGLQIRGFE